MELPSTSSLQLLEDTDSFSDLGFPLKQGSLLDTLAMKRRSSRPIKRRRFDDELVESSLPIAGFPFPRLPQARSPSLSTLGLELCPSSAVSSTSQMGNPVVTLESKQRRSNRAPFSGGRRNRRGRLPQARRVKDLGRWKPTDDLALILGVQQTNDLRMVYNGIKFSCRFTLQEVQQRWYALLYNPSVSRIAVAAMRNLQPDQIAYVQSRALFSNAEEQLLSTIKSSTSPGVDIFQDLLDKNKLIFHMCRTAKSLLKHWSLMRKYSLLSDQTVLPRSQRESHPHFADAEQTLDDSELMDVCDKATQAYRQAEIVGLHLKNEVARWQVLVDAVTGISPPDFDNQTLAVLRGRLVRYLMRSKETTFGRATHDMPVDIDLSLEGLAWKVSRRQGTIHMRNNGDFFLLCEGKRAIYVDGRAIIKGNKCRLNHNSVVDVAGLRFVFLINQDLVNAVRQEDKKRIIQL